MKIFFSILFFITLLSLSQSFQPSLSHQSIIKTFPTSSLKPLTISTSSSPSLLLPSNIKLYQSTSSTSETGIESSPTTSNSSDPNNLLPYETQTSYLFLTLLSITIGAITGYLVTPFKLSINTVTNYFFEKYGVNAPFLASIVLSLFFLFDSRVSSTFHIIFSKAILKFYSKDKSDTKDSFVTSNKNILTKFSYYFLFLIRVVAIYLSIGLTGFLGSAGPSGEIVTTIGLFLYVLLAHFQIVKLHSETMRNIMLSSFAAGIATNFNAPLASIAFAFHVTMPTINSSNPASPFYNEDDLKKFNEYNQPYVDNYTKETEGKEYKFDRIFKERFLQLFLAVLASTFVNRGYTFTLKNCKPGIQIPCQKSNFFPSFSELPLFVIAGSLSTFLYRHHLKFRSFINDNILSKFENKLKPSSSSSSSSSSPSKFNAKFYRPLLVGLLGSYYYYVKNPMPVTYGTAFLNQHGKLANFYKETSLSNLVKYFISRFYANAIAVLSSNPGGLISPSIFMGSTFFMLLSKLLYQLNNSLQLSNITLRNGMILTGMGLVSLNFKSKWLASFIICEMTMSKNWFMRVFFTTSFSFWLNNLLDKQKNEMKKQ